METTTLVWFLCISVGYVHGQPDPGTNPCGSDKWMQYKDESCLYVLLSEVNEEEYLSKDEAEIACNTMAGERNSDVPKLLRIKTKEKQDYLKYFLYDEGVVDSVWLGINLGDDGDFQWNDGGKLFFNNWVKDDSADQNNHCVQMEFGDGSESDAEWKRVSCQKKNVVVCEKSQKWSTPNLLDAFINLKLEFEYKQNQAREKFDTLKENMEKEIDDLRRTQRSPNQTNELALDKLIKNPVPIGFIYFQLPYQSEPVAIWPEVKWTDVSNMYAGYFFRVIGDDTNNFGDYQEGSAPHLENVECVTEADNKVMETSIPKDGGVWSDPVSMGWRASGSTWRGLRFKMSNDEVVPKNFAMKVWMRLL